jgi:GDP-L-fucose synthase
MFDLSNKFVLVTGSDGFLGRFVCDELIKQDSKILKLTSSDDLTKEECVEKYKNIKIDYVIHLAGYNGGIAFNQTYPFDIFSKNTLMANNALRIAINSNVKKFIGVLTSCGYPPDNGLDITEDSYLDDKPHDSISSHGYAKRNLLIGCQMAHKQFDLNATCVVPNTIYGPGDTLDLIRTKVMMAMIKRFSDAKKNNLSEVICWGTGKPIREFIYVEDVAKLIIESLKKIPYSNTPLNLSTGHFFSIKELALIISKEVGFKGKITWDTSKPDGQFQKVLNTDNMKKFFPDFSATDIITGIRNTINWYENFS